MASPNHSIGGSPLESPSPPTSPDEAYDLGTSPPSAATASSRPALSPRAGTAGTAPSSVSNMTTSSQPLGNVNAARGRPPAPAYNPDIMAKMKAFSISRQHTPTVQSPGPSVPGFPGGMKLPPSLNRPLPHPSMSSPAVPGTQPPQKGLSLAERRGGMKLPGGLPGAPASQPANAAPAPRQKPKMTLSQMQGASADGQQSAPMKQETQMERYKEFVDTKTGALTFKNKAVVDSKGITFASGRSFSISLEEIEVLDEMGKGNYGTVVKARHSRPQFRKHGMGLAGNKVTRPQSDEAAGAKGDGTSGAIMAIKEIRLELDDAKFATIIMELDVLHRCISPYIIDFFGAFFQEGSVYICMEFMDSSVEKVYGDGVPEGVLRKITHGTVMGLKCLKDEHNIIHRDVKPTNILVNKRGEVKICDFGVSGNLVASIAKTNIGCQSYMAPERISSGNVSQPGTGIGTYSVQSDIWSLGLTIIECALGRYPYAPETYNNIFSQLSAIVDGDAPDLPGDAFSPAAHDFVAGCLNKIPNLRPTYAMLLQHAWLAPLVKPSTIVEEDEDEEAIAASEASTAPLSATADVPIEAAGGDFVDREVGEWVMAALDRRARGVMGKAPKPALHTAPLDATGSPVQELKGLVV